MSGKWLSIIGVTEAGIENLGQTERTLVREAEVILGPDRMVGQLADSSQTLVKWEKSFASMVEQVKALRGRKTVILATGDPSWFGIGASLQKHLQTDEFALYPAVSSFQLAAARLNWPLQHVHTITLHGRPVENLARYLAPGARILALTSDAKTLDHAVGVLENRGFSASRLTVLENLGGPDERIKSTVTDHSDSNANQLDSFAIGDFYVLAIDCVADTGTHVLSRAPGLPDQMFENDGQLTKSHMRAVTVSALAPWPGALLWDVGAGSGSVGIEFMRAAEGARAIAFERDEKRCEMIENNARNLGVPGLKLVRGEAPASLNGVEAPDAVFLGGDVASDAIFDHCWQALKPGGALVANAVTLSAERALLRRQAELGGELAEFSVSVLDRIGAEQVMRPRMSVLQWHIRKDVCR